MKAKFTLYVGPGMQMRTYLDDVHEYVFQAPRFISRWGRADSVYHWLGCIIRPKASYWKAGVPEPYGIVVEVGRASWLCAIWEDGSESRARHVGREVDCWHYQELDSMRQDMLRRKFTDDQLREFVRTYDKSRLIPTG